MRRVMCICKSEILIENILKCILWKSESILQCVCLPKRFLFRGFPESLHMVSHMSGNTWQPYYQNKYVVKVVFAPFHTVYQNPPQEKAVQMGRGETTTIWMPVERKILCLLNFLILTASLVMADVATAREILPSGNLAPSVIITLMEFHRRFERKLK